MKVLIDMNLTPLWVEVLQKEGWEVLHWSSVGEHGAPDTEIFDYAKRNGYIIFTHDLDFGAILAAAKSDFPSVFQVRTQDVMPDVIGSLVVNAFHQFEQELEMGAFVTVNEAMGKVRVLPIS